MNNILSFYIKKIEQVLSDSYPELGSNPFYSPILQKWVYNLTEIFKDQNYYKEGTYFKQKEYIAAYLSFIFPQSLFKTYLILNELVSFFPSIFSNKSKLDIADLGAGMGASSFGIYEFFSTNYKTLMLHYDVIEKNELPLSIFKKMIDDNQYFKNANFSIKKTDINTFINSRDNLKDIIVLSLVLSELSSYDSISLIKKILRHLKKDGIFIIIEPALRKCSLNLISIRNKIIKQNINVLLPCLFENECQLEKQSKYWCYKELKWNAPEHIQIINRKLYRDIHNLKFSFLILSPKKIERNSLKNIYRSITSPSLEKGKTTLKACNSNAEIINIELLKRDLSGDNKQFLELQIGTCFTIDDFEDKAGSIRIKKTTKIKSIV